MVPINITESAHQCRFPLTIRLPSQGQVDEIFGCPRQKYLQLERDGVLRLIRLVPKGKRRGIVLVPVDQMWAHLEALHHDH
jgi:hypothetical protein